MDNQEDFKGRNHPKIKEALKQLKTKHPILNAEYFKPTYIRAVKQKLLDLTEKMKEQEDLIGEGKGMLENKFEGLKLNEERTWLNICSDMDVDTIMNISEDELIAYVRSWLFMLDFQSIINARLPKY